MLLPWCNRPAVILPNPLCWPPKVTVPFSGLTHIPHFRPPVCGADESSPGRAGRAGCHGLQVRADRGKEAILLPGGPAVLRDQTAHQLSLQGRVPHVVTPRLYILNFRFIGKSSDLMKRRSEIVAVSSASGSYPAEVSCFRPRCESFCPKSCRRGSSPALSPPSCQSAP